MSICAVILAGGSGTRLWPLSTSKRPKQFSSLFSDETMLQSTIKRLSGLDVSSTIIICNEEHRFIVAEQLRNIDNSGSIILEPVGRNTAPAIALAAIYAKNDPLMLVLAADHLIENKTAFIETISDGIPCAESGKLVTFGIVPNEVNTGYGYIERGKKYLNGYHVQNFTEKPSLQVAKNYVDSGKFYWNSGMFLFKASSYLQELKKLRSDIYDLCVSSLNKGDFEGDFIRPNKELFKSCPTESIDYAVMEKTSKSIVIPMNAGWNDIGSWKSLWSIGDKDKNGNVIQSDVVLHNTKNSYIRSDDKLIAVTGLDDLVIVSLGDKILVANKESIQDVKIIAELVKMHAQKDN